MRNKLFILGLALSFSVSLFAQVPTIVPTASLEAWWSFDGNANDLSANANNFTNNGSTSLTADRNGIANSAYNFNGINQYLLVNSPSFSFAQTDSFSVSFWTQKTSNQYGIAVCNLQEPAEILFGFFNLPLAGS
jgi:hypothetical protein